MAEATTLVYEKRLVHAGIVTSVSNTGSFAIAGLSGFGDTFFGNWTCEVMRNAGTVANAPKGEKQRILTYTSNGGVFTSIPFTLLLAVGDEVYLVFDALASALYGIQATLPLQLPNGIVENFLLTIGTPVQEELGTEFDMSNLTQKCTIREYDYPDGVNPRQSCAKIFPDDFDAGTVSVRIKSVIKNSLYRVSFQSAVAEGAIRDIPCRVLAKVIP